MTTATIEDHALLSDQRTAALVTRDGDIDWLCMPRFDSPSLFTSLLGEEGDGHWSLRIADGEVLQRRYIPSTLVLETTWRGPSGRATITEFLPIVPHDGEDDAGAGSSLAGDVVDHSDLLRLVQCTEGEVEVVQELVLRPSYGRAVPWAHRGRDVEGDSALILLAGSDGLALHGPALTPHDRRHRGSHRLEAGQEACWSLTWFPSWLAVPAAPDPHRVLASTTAHWAHWLGQVRVDAEYAEPIARSLLVLRGLTHRATGGIIAAATASLPEDFGGERNWDYRYCWLRDAALSLEALLTHGHVDAAEGWRDWLLRAIAGDPENMQIMYTVTGSRDMPEHELEHLAGYEGSKPVRIGNGAASQYQADVVGEVMLALAQFREEGIEETHWSWGLQKALVTYTTVHFDEPDQGLWEMRGEPAFFTQGRVMVWATFDRAIDAVERYALPATDAELAQWRELRDRVRAEVLDQGVHEQGYLTQTYGSDEVDASLLQLTHARFLDHDDPILLRTVEQIERDLVTEAGLVLRYRTRGQDGLSGHEHPFLVCCFWLVEQYARSGRREDAVELMDRTLACSNDLYLMAEEYDGTNRRMAGNFPQAFSHLGLIRAVDALNDTAEATAS